MTHSGGKPHQVGDRGQRFEVSFFDPKANKRCILGWTTTIEDARMMVSAVEGHPTWDDAQITDREKCAETNMWDTIGAPHREEPSL